MNKYSVPCYWEVKGFYEIEASSPEEAKAKAEKLPLPPISDAIYDSWEIPLEEIEEISVDKEDTWR